jgi:hypothetical protein
MSDSELIEYARGLGEIRRLTHQVSTDTDNPMNRSIFTFAVAAATLIAPVAAQTPCLSANATAKTGFTGGNTNIFCVQMPVQTSAITISAVEWFTRKRTTTNGTLNSAIYLTTGSNVPNTTPVRTGSVSVTSTAWAWHRVTFSSPYTVAAKQAFCITNQVVNATHPISRDTGGTRVNYRWRRPTSTAWSSNVPQQQWAFKVYCGTGGTFIAYGTGCGKTVPVLSNTGAPNINSPLFSVDLAKAPASANSILGLGIGRQNISLTLAGAPGCTLLISPLLIFTGNTSATGTRKTILPIPNTASLVGQKFNTQYAIASNQNTMGLIWSNGGEGTVGK